MLRYLLLGLSLYWRLLVVSLLLSAAIVLSLFSSPALSGLTFIKLKPTILHGLSGAVWLVSLLALPNGIVYVVWGKRLNLPTSFWRGFTFAIGVLFLALAAVNLLAAYLLPLESWLDYKLFVPSAAVLVTTFVTTAILARRSQQTGNVARASGEA